MTESGCHVTEYVCHVTGSGCFCDRQVYHHVTESGCFMMEWVCHDMECMGVSC